MWPSQAMPPTISVVPKEPTRLPPLADKGEAESIDEARRWNRKGQGANDMASISRKRRDLALANREKPSQVPLTLPGTLLKSSPPLVALEKRPSPSPTKETVDPQVAPEGADVEWTAHKNEVDRGWAETQGHPISLRSAIQLWIFLDTSGPKVLHRNCRPASKHTSAWGQH
eukprot:Skav224035  [mRNA]  locus=scaffold4539:108525:114561:- [translate_table: standard]